jgi:hypothetical protein
MSLGSDLGVTRGGRAPFSMSAIAAKTAALKPAVQSLTGDFYGPVLLVAFVAGEILSQLALLSQFFAPARVLVRTASFIGNIVYLFALQRAGGTRHPSWRFALLSLVVVAASILHPDTSNAWAGLASVLLHASVLAPIFWVPRVKLNERTVYNVFLMLWLFHSASAVVGALQAYFPGSFQPALSTAFNDMPFLVGLEINLSDGSRIFRPMGLSDMPGGAAMAAVYSVLLGAGFLLDRRTNWFFRAVVIGAMAMGLVALYLTQVRSLLIMMCVSVLAMGLPLALQRRLPQFGALAATFVGIAVFGFGAAVAVGGEDVTNRFFTLISEDPGTVYYTNRGLFLQNTFENLLPTYPLGAGLGRWGMVYRYFGSGPGSAPGLWAEIQWTAWLYDGGVLLILLYTCAILVALWVCLKIAADETLAEQELRKWAAVLFGYGVGAVAITFNSPMFESTGGVDFWILNTAVFAAATQGGMRVRGAVTRPRGTSAPLSGRRA